MVFKIRLSTVVMIVMLSVVLTSAAFADEEGYIAVPREYVDGHVIGLNYDKLADGEKNIILNGFAVDWPFFWPSFPLVGEAEAWKISVDFGRKISWRSRRELTDAFPKYYKDLIHARHGAELVNNAAFDMYKKIIARDSEARVLADWGFYAAKNIRAPETVSGYGESMPYSSFSPLTFYFSPYGLVSSLWDFHALTSPGTFKDIYSKESILPMAKLRENIYDNFLNPLTKMEERFYVVRKEDRYFDVAEEPAKLIKLIEVIRDPTSYYFSGYSLYSMRPYEDLLRYRIHGSNFAIFNGFEDGRLFLQRYQAAYVDKTPFTGRHWVNSTVAPSLLLGSGAVNVEDDGVWCVGTMLYSQADGIELIRVRSNKLKQSFLFLYPKSSDAGDFKKIEMGLDIQKLKKLLYGMRPKNVAFRFGWRIFGDTEEKQTIQLMLPSSCDVITPRVNMDSAAIPVNFFLHDVSFSAGYAGKLETLETLPRKALKERYERVIPFERPFLFFVIDDPTGAILIMGRGAGYKNLKSTTEWTTW